MGQRSQIIVITDGVKYGNNNPNDNNGEIFVSHNQWRYGTNAIYILKHILDKLNFLINKNDISKEYFFSSIDREFIKCIRYAENHNINYDFSQSHDFENLTKEFSKSTDIMEFLNHYTDNNNGWFFIKINRDFSIELGVLNGFEECETVKQRTFKEYCNFFGKLDSEDLENIKVLESYKTYDIFKETEILRNRIKSDYK